MGKGKKTSLKAEPAPAESARPADLVQMPKVSDPPKFEFEFLTVGGQRRPKLSKEEHAELVERWNRKTFTLEDKRLLGADFERALCKYGHHPEEAKKQSASTTVQLKVVFYTYLADYALKSRTDRQSGGFNSSGVAESTEKPGRDQVVRAIKRAKDNGTPARSIPRIVRDGGINLSLRQIRNIGQQHKLLPKKGKR